ncbi:proton-coupled folate transporter isoform X2 [Diabrotica virgifera virgifera]|uniref:Proton-coupled folate transporter-like n=1 Tax=Diabrotica virgifera virgifera TaxID=50390 RepID=A0ABM5KC79_DIAVI|nr:proton-coupled folate transporter isoform X2 [Diabrotica virgifera virgifera]XP_050507798.1 proton-coupled folate transporter isoform X2 [Diabrotica virgifera virgifera]
MMDEPATTRYSNKFLHYFKYVTVEPTMLLYMMAFMTTNVAEQSFYVYKTCTINHGYNKTICDNINAPEYKNISKEVQASTAKFHVWNNIAGHVTPIILALFIGAWSDKRGRKLPLLIGLFGKLIFSLMIIVNTLQPSWPVEYVVFTATLPSALTGADVTIFATAFAYLVDVSSVSNRTMRVTILEVCYLASMPLGIAFGAYLFKFVFNRSYTYMFVVNSILMVLAILYTSLRLSWRSNSMQRPLSEASNKFLDFFDYNHAVSTFGMLSQYRPGNKRTYLWLLLIMMALYTFQRNERDIMLGYCYLTFHWNDGQYSIFKTIQSGLQDIILLLAIPIMSKIFKWRDTIIIMIGAIAHVMGRIFYSTAVDPYVFYIGGVFAAVGPIVAPVIRSLVSKTVSTSEKGKAFAVLAVADNAVPLIAGTSYNALYYFVLPYNPGYVFFLTIATQIGVFLLATYIHSRTHRNEFEIEIPPPKPILHTENDLLQEPNLE